jgi:hypothetical protein
LRKNVQKIENHVDRDGISTKLHQRLSRILNCYKTAAEQLDNAHLIPEQIPLQSIIQQFLRS